MTVEIGQLKSRVEQLPLRSMLAFIARCARRLQSTSGSTSASSSPNFENAIAELERQARTMNVRDERPEGTAGVSEARRLLDLALTEARHMTSNLIQSHVAATESIIRAARPKMPGPMDEIAKRRDMALAEYRTAAQHALELTQDLAADKIKAARRALHAAERSATAAAHSNTLAYHEIRHATSHAACAVVDVLGFVQPPIVPILSNEIERLSCLAGDASNASVFGDAIDATEKGPLGAYWPSDLRSMREVAGDVSTRVAEEGNLREPSRRFGLHIDAMARNRFDRAAHLIIRLADYMRVSSATTQSAAPRQPNETDRIQQ